MSKIKKKTLYYKALSLAADYLYETMADCGDAKHWMEYFLERAEEELTSSEEVFTTETATVSYKVTSC